LNVEIKDELPVLIDSTHIKIQCSLEPFNFDSTRTIISATIRNVTQSVTYTGLTFTGNIITIGGGSPLPTVDDQLRVDYVYERDPDHSVRAIITNVDYENAFIPASEWMQGDLIVTVSDAYKIGFRDRITLKDNFVRSEDTLRRYDVDIKGQSREILLYDATQGINENPKALVRDKYNIYAQNVDFQIGSNGSIIWVFTGASGNRPKHQAFTILYKGAGSTAVMTITSSALTTTINGAPGLNIPFVSYPTLQDLVDYINTLANYEAVISSDATEIDKQVAASEATNKLLPVAGVSIKTTAYQIFGEDRTQYSVEYYHYAVYSIWKPVGQVRHPDFGAPLPARYWARMWEKTTRTQTL
jgi:hypothetical protein